MNEQIDYAEFLLPLVIVKVGSSGFSLERYAGVAFFLGDGPLVATCRHIVQMVGENEKLMAFDMERNKFELVHDIETHEKYDFAVGKVFTNGKHSHFGFSSNSVALGRDVQALGFTSPGKDGADVTVEPRLLKGYVSLFWPRPRTPDSRSSMEVSFPSLKGFSGAPLVDANSELVGMLFSNYQSTIEQFAYQEVQDDKVTFKESMHRLVEFGLAHTIDDIRSFLKDLNVQC